MNTICFSGLRSTLRIGTGRCSAGENAELDKTGGAPGGAGGAGGKPVSTEDSMDSLFMDVSGVQGVESAGANGEKDGRLGTYPEGAEGACGGPGGAGGAAGALGGMSIPLLSIEKSSESQNDGGLLGSDNGGFDGPSGLMIFRDGVGPSESSAGSGKSG